MCVCVCVCVCVRARVSVYVNEYFNLAIAISSKVTGRECVCESKVYVNECGNVCVNMSIKSVCQCMCV